MLREHKDVELRRYQTIKQSDPELFEQKRIMIDAITIDSLQLKDRRLQAFRHWLRKYLKTREEESYWAAVAYGEKLGLSEKDLLDSGLIAKGEST
jgi:hypothetical protein